VAGKQRRIKAELYGIDGERRKNPLKAAGCLLRDGGDGAASKGLRAASNNRLTCTAEHFPRAGQRTNKIDFPPWRLT
jgi:hypothetical protein